MTMHAWMRLTVVFTALAIAATACGGGGGGTDEALRALTGDVVADGSSTVFPITQAIAEEFQLAGADNVKISVGSSGTGGGFKKFCAGETDLSDASRPIKDEEKAACAARSIEYVELKVAVDGLSVVTNTDNSFVDCLTTGELKQVFVKDSAVTNWNQIRAGFPSKPLRLYGPGTDSGTYDYFTDEINGEEGVGRSDSLYTPSEDDNVLVQGVSGDPNGLGYFGYAYYIQNKDKLKVLGVDGGTGCVAPNESSINDGSYKPLSRPLYVYVAKDSISKPQVKAFMDFYLEEVDGLLQSVGYVPLHEDDMKASLSAWAAAAA